MPGVDEKDREILRILRKEGRITLTELGRRIGLSPPASVKNRMEKLEKLGGAIRGGYSAVVDPPAFLDEYVQAFLELRLAIDDHTVDPILRRIAGFDEVQAIYRRSGRNRY